jgi:hypothetical protein
VNSPESGQQSLRNALRELADDEESLGASSTVEARLRRHVRELAPVTRRRWPTYIAAAALVGLFVAVWRLMPAEPPSRVRSSIPSDIEAEVEEFLPLPYAHLPTSDGQVIRIAVSRESLVSFGLTPGSPDSPDAVLADVFVGDDGIARAVRFIEPLN